MIRIIKRRWPIPAWLVLSAVMLWAAEDGAKTAENKNQLSGEIADLKKEISKLEKEIDKTRSLAAEEAKRFETMRSNNHKDLDSRNKERLDLQKKMEGLVRDITRQKQKQTAFGNQLANIALQEKKLSALLADECRRLTRLVEQSLPWELEERSERINTLRRDLESGSATFEEGFSRLKGLYDDEIKAGDEVNLFNKPIIRNNGETVNAHILKMGNQWIVYMDEEEKNYGALQRTLVEDSLRYTWKEELDFADRKAIREAIEIKMAKKPPKLVRLPLTLSLNAQPQAKGEQ